VRGVGSGSSLSDSSELETLGAEATSDHDSESSLNCWRFERRRDIMK
jgi:hypothetical protein